MSNERKCIYYVESKYNENGKNGVIISTYNKNVIIGTTEEFGSDSEAIFDIETAKVIVEMINKAIEEASN